MEEWQVHSSSKIKAKPIHKLDNEAFIKSQAGVQGVLRIQDHRTVGEAISGRVNCQRKRG